MLEMLVLKLPPEVGSACLCASLPALLPFCSANQVMKSHSLQRVPTLRTSVIGQEGACSLLYNQAGQLICK